MCGYFVVICSLGRSFGGSICFGVVIMWLFCGYFFLGVVTLVFGVVTLWLFFLSYGHIWFWEWSLYGNFVVIFCLVWSRMWLFYGYFVVIRVVTLWLLVLLCVWLLYGYFMVTFSSFNTF